MAPSIIIESKDAEILVNTPTINKIPGIVSARAIGICISAGSPKGPVKNPTKPEPNFPVPCAINITPTAARRPQNAMSRSLFSLNFASANEWSHFMMNLKDNCKDCLAEYCIVALNLILFS